MDWRTVRFDWNRARAFLVTAEEGSFSAAARSLGSTQPTIGRQVAALEEELGVTLFERVAGRLELTATGLALVDEVRAMGESATRVSRLAAGQAETIEGSVTITASEVIAGHLLPPILAGLRRDHPGIELEVVASNTLRDLHRREADIAIRNVSGTQPDLIARKVRDTQAHFYASPAYVERVGGLATADDLARAEILGFDRTDQMIEGFARFGIVVHRDQFPVVTAQQLVQWELCKHGLGIGMMMADVGDAEPRVQRVLHELPSIPVPMWLVCHRELRTSRRIRTVYDRLVDSL